MSKIIVIGGGPAGMFAAIAAAEASASNEVILLEKNEKLGKKLFITGKGRCNITNASDMEVLFSNVMSNAKFLYSAFYSYDNMRVIDFFERNGLRTKVERGNRVFPVSDHSSDVIATLNRVLKEKKVKVMLHTEVGQILMQEEEDGTKTAVGVKLKNQTTLMADRMIIATGGFSYQTTGSTGDGYRFAEEAGHTVTEISPALVPFYAKEEYVMRLQGLSLKNVEVRIYDGKKLLYEEFGEMLFTHFGVSGPLILSASAALKPAQTKKELTMKIDLKPAVSEEQLDKRLLREFEEAKNKQFKNAVAGLFPAKMTPIMIEVSGIDQEKKVNEVTKEERHAFISLIKAFPVTLCGLRDFNEAIITKGGVKVKEIDPSTMESKRTRHLYFCGEVLDLDAMTGGYNLQIAWSTGYLAGNSAGSAKTQE